MMKYKILKTPHETFVIQKENSQFFPSLDNPLYNIFLEDVSKNGIEIVEGPDIIEPDYATLRQQEYPSREEQLDMMYWDRVNGTNIWEETIQAIKDKYPKTITGGTTIGPVPDWVQDAADNWTFNKQLREYVTKEVFNEETGEVETVEITENVITQTAIEPLEEFIEVIKVDAETMESVTETVRNPLIVRDEKERTQAQEVIDNTPQEVIDAINT
jgi:hypothetical protein